MATTAADIIASIRDQIPDPVADVITTDGTAFTRATLLRWLNDAGRMLCTAAPVIVDWGAVPSTLGMDTYELDSFWVGVEQAWYDLRPLGRTAAMDDFFTSKVEARSWWFGPHSLHATPRLHVWPACDRSGAATTLAADISATATGITGTDTSGFLSYGYLRIDNELVLYRTNAGNTFTNILRGQGGTVAAAHTAGATVRECNIFWKGSRLPRPLTAVGDVVEIPAPLWPLLELYVLSKVREAEQDHQVATAMLRDFRQLVDDLANKYQARANHAQGLQVRLGPVGPHLYRGRTYIP